MRAEIPGLVLACPAHILLAPRALSAWSQERARVQISRVSGASLSFAQFFFPGWSSAGPGEGLRVRARHASGVKLFRLRLKALPGASATRVADSKLDKAHQPQIRSSLKAHQVHIQSDQLRAERIMALNGSPSPILYGRAAGGPILELDSCCDGEGPLAGRVLRPGRGTCEHPWAAVSQGTGLSPQRLGRGASPDSEG